MLPGQQVTFISVGGMGLGRGCGQLICYNCGGPGHYARDCTNSKRISYSYCEKFDHEMVYFPTLIAQIHEKGVLQSTLTQNIQMMRSEPCKEEPNVKMVLRSSVTIGEDEREHPKEDMWACKAPTKEPESNSKCMEETFIEAKKSFTEASTSGSKDQPELGMEPSMLTTFLETCMKLLRENKELRDYKR